MGSGETSALRVLKTASVSMTESVETQDMRMTLRVMNWAPQKFLAQVPRQKAYRKRVCIPKGLPRVELWRLSGKKRKLCPYSPPRLRRRHAVCRWERALSIAALDSIKILQQRT